MRLNQAGRDLIKRFEGCKLKAYRCAAGVLTIGYGHTGDDVYVGQQISQEEAVALLNADLDKFVTGVEKLVTVDLNDNQFSALVSLAFNIGLGNLKKSNLLKKVNAKDFIGALESWLKWNKAGGKVLKGLTARREAEKELFLKGPCLHCV